MDTDDKVICPATGTPQGGIVSPVLANIYLHYALDVWFEQTVKSHCVGKAYLCRYADDFICAFTNESDAKRFYKVLGKRLARFNLEVAEDKTHIIRFSRFQKEKTQFEFLGFEFRWGKSRFGKIVLKRRTSPKKLRKAKVNFTGAKKIVIKECQFCLEKLTANLGVTIITTVWLVIPKLLVAFTIGRKSIF